jgi:hypothetical protein
MMFSCGFVFYVSFGINKLAGTRAWKFNYKWRKVTDTQDVPGLAQQCDSWRGLHAIQGLND